MLIYAVFLQSMLEDERAVLVSAGVPQYVC
jgi:hypothetical protein